MLTKYFYSWIHLNHFSPHYDFRFHRQTQLTSISVSAFKTGLSTQSSLHITKEKVNNEQLNIQSSKTYNLGIYSTSNTLECLNTIVDNISNNNDGSSNTLCTPSTSSKKSFPQ